MTHPTNRSKELHEQQRQADKARHEDRIGWLAAKAPRLASGTVKIDEKVSVPPWEITVFVGATTTAEFGEGPSFAKFTVNDRFIAQLQRLKALCEDQGLTEVRVTAGPDLWGGCDENELRLQCPELVVTCGSFWFNDRPKHMDYEIQTRGQSIDSFIKMVSEDGPQERFIDGIEEEIAALDAAGILDAEED
jgi:hypothetical protein